MVRRQRPAECGGAAGVRVEPPQRVLGLGLWPGGQDPPGATPSLPHWPLPADRALGVRRKSQLRVSRPRAVTRLAASESLQGERTAGPKGRGRRALSWLLPEAWKREGTAGHCCPPGRDIRAHFLTKPRLPWSLGCERSSHPHAARGGRGGSSPSVVMRSEASPWNPAIISRPLGATALADGPCCCPLMGTGHFPKPRRPAEGAPAWGPTPG